VEDPQIRTIINNPKIKHKNTFIDELIAFPAWCGNIYLVIKLFGMMSTLNGAT
jgi:hypothetical protein